MSGDDAGFRPGCIRYADGLAELALGISMGRERALILAHVEGCSNCDAEMEQLSLAADSLLETATAIEPPLGFEVRLMERFGARLAAQRTRAPTGASSADFASSGLPRDLWCGRRRRRVARVGRPVSDRNAVRIRDHARWTNRNGITRRGRSHARRSRRRLGPDELALHEPRRRHVVR